MLTQEGRRATARHQAFPLPLGAAIEAAEPSQIAVAAGLQNESVDLVRGDAAFTLLLEIAQGPVLRPPQGVESFKIGQPEREIDVLAFMPDREDRKSTRL